uniref:Uncharacterized protein n=1 Tax=Oryza punctata TaxID=4537 RepID=A0A0E0K287_ORYPU
MNLFCCWSSSHPCMPAALLSAACLENNLQRSDDAAVGFLALLGTRGKMSTSRNGDLPHNMFVEQESSRPPYGPIQSGWPIYVPVYVREQLETQPQESQLLSDISASHRRSPSASPRLRRTAIYRLLVLHAGIIGQRPAAADLMEDNINTDNMADSSHVPVPPPNQTNETKAKPKRKTLFSFYKKVYVEGQDNNDLVDQNPQLDENELEEAPAPPKVQRLNSDAIVLIVERDPAPPLVRWRPGGGLKATVGAVGRG